MTGRLFSADEQLTLPLSGTGGRRAVTAGLPGPHSRRWRTRRVALVCRPALAVWVGLMALLLLPSTLAAPSSASGELAPTPLPSTASVPGATIVGQRWLTERTMELTVSTPSFTAPASVEIVFPNGYFTDPTRRWPTTYHLNGTNGDQTWFRTVYNGEALTEDYPSIVVVPAGHAGYWSDWYNSGTNGPPAYETFVTQQLIPLVDANFRTIAKRSQRAVMGDSMGGYGALMLAARHPDLFTAASSLSGAPDSNWVVGAAAITASSSIDLGLPDSIYGPRATQEVRWRGHNPTDLARNLGSLDVQLYTGNGVLSATEADPVSVAMCAVEAGIIRPETESAHRALVDRGIPHTFTSYDWGCHSPVMFQQEIAETLPRFARRFSQDVSLPDSFDFRAIEPHFSVFGWSIGADPDRALEFIDLHDVGATGFTITGSGATQVNTPPLFKGRASVTVLINGVPSRIAPHRDGSLRLVIDLGPASRDQQYTIGAMTIRRSAVVRFVRP